jgi:hypothetical protein
VLVQLAQQQLRNRKTLRIVGGSLSDAGSAEFRHAMALLCSDARQELECRGSPCVASSCVGLCGKDASYNSFSLADIDSAGDLEVHVAVVAGGMPSTGGAHVVKTDPQPVCLTVSRVCRPPLVRLAVVTATFAVPYLKSDDKHTTNNIRWR